MRTPRERPPRRRVRSLRGGVPRASHCPQLAGAPGVSARPVGEPSSGGPSEAEPDEVTLRVQDVEFEMKLRPGVHAFLREMSSLDLRGWDSKRSERILLVIGWCHQPTREIRSCCTTISFK